MACYELSLSGCEENYEMNGKRIPQEIFVHSRIQPSEQHAPLKYAGMSEERLQILTQKIVY